MSIYSYLIMCFLTACLVVSVLVVAGLLTAEPDRPLTIFIVTLVGNCKETRCVGWYPEFAYAHEAVMSDLSDVRYYSYAVIEEVQASVHGEVVNAHWFALHKGVWQSVERPKWAQSVVGWGLG